MSDSKWKLTDEEAEEVERGHREMMKMHDAKPIRMSLDGKNLRAQAEFLAEGLIEKYGAEMADIIPEPSDEEHSDSTGRNYRSIMLD